MCSVDRFDTMSGVPMGKLLLRNVIRHTDAHNKIQEESEMWKLRNLERRPSSSRAPDHRGQMHCDRYLDSEGSTQSRLGDGSSLRDEKEAKYWTRKLYEFEAGDPDRWGHSGFKELYPEEFQSDGEEDCGGKQRRKKRKISLKADIEKNPKKSSKKKRKKEKKKKKTVDLDSESCSDAEDSGRRKKGGKDKHRKKKHKSKERPEDSSTEDSHSEKRPKTRRKRDARDTDSLTEPQTKKRKNWRVAKDERSAESSDG